MDVKKQKKAPAPMPVRVDNIPDALRGIDQWVNWRWTWKEKTGKWDKPPFAADGSYGSSTDPEKWTDFDTAIAAVDEHDFSGVGLAMGNDGIGLVGVDLDNCRDHINGFVKSDAQAIVDMFDTYTEVSPSGTGLKLWLKGDYDKAKWRSKVGDIEVYRDGRYFTVTGHVYHDRPIRQVGETFTAFLDKYLRKEEPAKTETAPIEASDDDDRIRHALNACMKVEVDEGEGDGSRRLVKYCRQCVRAGLSPEGTITVIRMLEPLRPFPKKWSDAEIRKRYADATNQSEVGEAVQQYKECDYDMARRVRDYANGIVLYIPEWKKWLAWNGRAYVTDHHNKVAELIVTVSNLMLKSLPDGDEKEVKAYANFCMKYQSAKGIADIERLCRGFLAADYRELDRRPNHYHCENGVVVLGENGVRFQEHNRENLNTVVTSVPYLLGSKCPRWEKFIAEITSGDRSLAQYLQMIFGHCLTGKPSQELFILHGSGRNGKGVFCEILQQILGEYGGPISQDLLMNNQSQHPTQFAYLYGKRAVIAQETDQECQLNENQVKMLTGGDRIQCRRMNEDFWSFAPSHKILLATNHVPTIRGTDNGIWRRIKLIPFAVVFEHDDPALVGRLSEELPGILQWAIRGFDLYSMIGGFTEPEVVSAAKIEYRAEMSIAQQFVEDRCVVDKKLVTATAKLYQNYRLYCEEHGHRACSARKFNNDLTSFGVKNGRTPTERIKIGIGLNSELALHAN
jgi:putative DNA primase/helicase